MPIEEIPRITKPLQQFPSPVSGVYNDNDFVYGDGTHVIQGHYWRRVQATNIPCGNTVGLKIGLVVGISQTILAEVASALEIGAAPLKNTLTAKMSISDILSNQRTIEFTRTVGPKKCIGITFAEWQRIVISTLRRQKYFLGFKTRQVERSVEIGTEETYTDQFEYPDPSCCSKEIEDNISSGFDKIYTLNFGTVRIAMLSKENAGGSVSLAGMTGHFHAGARIPLDRIAQFLAARGHVPDSDITLSNSLGSARDFYGRATESSGPSSTSLPWVIAAGCGSVLAYIFKGAKGATDLSTERDSVVESSADPYGKETSEAYQRGRRQWEAYVNKGRELTEQARKPESESSEKEPEPAKYEQNI